MTKEVDNAVGLNTSSKGVKMSFHINPLISAKANVLALLGFANKLEFAESDYELGSPEAIEASPRNTQLEITASRDNPFTGSVVARYRRLSLEEAATPFAGSVVGPSDDAATVVAEFAKNFGIVNTEVELLTPLPASNSVDHGQIITLKFGVVNPSLLYLASEISIPYTWTESPLSDLIRMVELPGFAIAEGNLGFPYTLPLEL